MPNDSTTPHRASLRQALLRALPGDSDLDAFCLDFFSSVHQRFSQGMDRQAKLNLLLQYAPTDEVAAKLARVAPEVLSLEHEHTSVGASLLANSSTIPSRAGPRAEPRPAHRGRPSLWVLTGLVLVLGWIFVFHWTGGINLGSTKKEVSKSVFEELTFRPSPAQRPVATNSQTTKLDAPPPESHAARQLPSSKSTTAVATRKPVHIKKKEPANVQPAPPKYVLPPLEK